MTAAAGRSPRDSERQRTGWPYFLLWAASAFLAAWSLILVPIGLVLYPPLVGLGMLIRRSPRAWPEVLGAAPGVGAVALLVAYFNRNSVDRCRYESACYGTDPTPWLMGGGVLVAAGTLVFPLLLHLDRRSSA